MKNVELAELVNMFTNPITIVYNPEFINPDFKRRYLDVPCEIIETEREFFIRLNGLKYFSKQSADKLKKKKQRKDEETLKRYGTRYIEDKNRFIEDNLGLAHLIASKFPKLDFDEALSEAFFTLSRAVDKFDYNRGFRFSTYACQAMFFELLRLSEGAKKRRKHFIDNYDEHSKNTPDNTKPRCDNTEINFELLEKIVELNLAGLDERERRIIDLRFLQDGSRLTYEKIGRVVKLSKERVRQVQNKALKKLRATLEEKAELLGIN